MRTVRRDIRPTRRHSHGQALTELAISAVLLVTLLVGSAQVALLYYDQISVATAARESAVVASENPGNTGLFTSPNSPTSYSCSGPSDPIRACAAAFNSTHGGTFGGLINTAGLTVTLQGATYPGSTATVCSGSTGTSDGQITVKVVYSAPIFVPFIGALFGSGNRAMTSIVTIRVEPCHVTNGA